MQRLVISIYITRSSGIGKDIVVIARSKDKPEELKRDLERMFIYAYDGKSVDF